MNGCFQVAYVSSLSGSVRGVVQPAGRFLLALFFTLRLQPLLSFTILCLICGSARVVRSLLVAGASCVCVWGQNRHLDISTSRRREMGPTRINVRQCCHCSCPRRSLDRGGVRVPFACIGWFIRRSVEAGAAYVCECARHGHRSSCELCTPFPFLLQFDLKFRIKRVFIGSNLGFLISADCEIQNRKCVLRGDPSRTGRASQCSLIPEGDDRGAARARQFVSDIAQDLRLVGCVERVVR